MSQEKPNQTSTKIDFRSWIPQIIFEDAYLIAIEKPAGLPSQATVDKTRPDLFRLLNQFLNQREKSEIYLALHHRLDLETSGVMVLAKSQLANKPLSDCFREHTAKKTYMALAEVFDPLKTKINGQDHWIIENHLKKDKQGREVYAVMSGGDFAKTEFSLKERSQDGKFALIEARPQTGRMHQIRAHLFESGMMILGDRVYKPKGQRQSAFVSRMMLHAKSLILPHPITKKELVLESQLPAEFSLRSLTT